MTLSQKFDLATTHIQKAQAALLEIVEGLKKEAGVQCEDPEVKIILEVVSEHLRLTPTMILSKLRVEELVNARTLVIGLVHELLDYTQQRTADALLLKDHGTVVHHLKRGTSFKANSPRFAADYAMCRVSATGRLKAWRNSQEQPSSPKHGAMTSDCAGLD